MPHVLAKLILESVYLYTFVIRLLTTNHLCASILDSFPEKCNEGES